MTDAAIRRRRAGLVKRKLGGALTESEERELAELDLELDRIEDAKYGEQMEKYKQIGRLVKSVRSQIVSEDDRGANMCGEAAGLEKAAEMLRARSGKLFAGGMDAEARAVRQLAAEIDGSARAQRRACREYCDEYGLASAPCDEDKP